MRYTDALLFMPDFRFHRLDFTVDNGVFTGFFPHSGEGVSLYDALVVPGLIDLHCHGAIGEDFTYGGDIDKIARFLAKNGTTSFLATSLTTSEEVLTAAYRRAAEYHGHEHTGSARMLGINMEGPFFSHKKGGAQDPTQLRLPSAAEFLRLWDACEGLIRIADLAPELDGAFELIACAKERCTVSLAHTACDYATAFAAFDAGVSHVTHLYCGMEPMHHRAPGPIPAAVEHDNVTAELIADGVHVSPAMVRMAFRMFGPERVCLISDALAVCGLPDGDYAAGGMKVSVHDGAAWLPSGTLAGSARTLLGIMQKAISFGIPKEAAIRSCTANPARVLGETKLGVIESGAAADFLALNEDMTLLGVYSAGRV